MLAIAAGYYYLASQIQASSLADNVGPGGLPKVLAVLLGVTGIAMMARAILIKPAVTVPDETAGTPEDAEHTASFARVTGLAAIAIAYIFLIGVIGYSIAIALLIVAVAIYEGERPSLRLALVAASGALFFYLLFVRLLSVPMPSGLLPSGFLG